MKNALITGGTGKIGSQIVLHLRNQGYNLAILYNHSSSKVDILKTLFKESTLKAEFFQCDLSKYNEIDRAFNLIRNYFSSLDLLINCAGIFYKKEFYEVEEADWNDIININLKATYFMNQKFSKIMQQNSLIINFASVGGIKFWKGYSLYNISKAAVIALTKSLALELAPKIRVNAIAPGYIVFNEDQSLRKMPLEKIPLKKYGTIEHVLKTIDFLIENNSITGVTIPLDGGRFLI